MATNKAGETLLQGFTKLDPHGTGFVDEKTFNEVLASTGLADLGAQVLQGMGTQPGQDVDYKVFLKWVGFEPSAGQPPLEHAVTEPAPTPEQAPPPLQHASSAAATVAPAAPSLPDTVDDGQSVKVSIIAGRDLSIASESITNILVSVQPPRGDERQAADLTCVIDTSGSMGAEATIQSAGGTTERHGLSLLDVAKHGVRTIIKTLTDKDRLSIVSFESRATTVLPLTAMDQAGHDLAEKQLDDLCAGGGTDIWQGLQHGLDALRTGAERGRLGHIMLLTDGETQSRETVIPNLQKYTEKYERLPGTISTFGFGYRLDSKLLVQLATEGSGSYSFIPDAGFVGTAFVNSMSNLLVTMAREVYLALEPDSGAEIVGISSSTSGGIPVVNKGGYPRVHLGTLQYGQARDIIVPMKIKDTSEAFLVASVQYESVAGELVTCNVEATAAGAQVDTQLVERHHCRCQFAEAIFRSLVDRETKVTTESEVQQARDMLNNAIEEVKASPAKELNEVKTLLEDMTGQSTEALSRLDYFQKWGGHYLPSVMFAHRLQQCNNFKDPGVQVYGGALYQDARDTADEAFNTLPAPKPSLSQSRGGSASQAYSAPVSMAAYNDCSAG